MSRVVHNLKFFLLLFFVALIFGAESSANAKVDSSDSGYLSSSNQVSSVKALLAPGPPIVSGTVPGDGDQNISYLQSDFSIVYTFNESIYTTGSGPVVVVQLVCDGISVNLNPSSVSGASQLTITATEDLPSGKTCTATLLQSGIVDFDNTNLDGNGDGIAGDNHVMTFDTLGDDRLPNVQSTSPNDNQGAIPLNSSIILSFDLAVQIQEGGVILTCNGVNKALSGLPVTVEQQQITLTPQNLQQNESCTVRLVADKIQRANGNKLDGDRDGTYEGSPTDDHVFTFLTVGVPIVTETTPSNGASGVDLSAATPVPWTIYVMFSSNVELDDSTTLPISMSCNGQPENIFLFHPPSTKKVDVFIADEDIPQNVTCTVTLDASKITDVNTGEALDGDGDGSPGGNYVFSFSTGTPIAPPKLSSSIPASGTTVPSNTNVTLNFDSAVLLSSNTSVQLTCNGSLVSLSGLPSSSSASHTLTPTQALPTGQSCELLLKADDIRNSAGTTLDGNGNGTAEGSLADDISISFSTEQALSTPPTLDDSTPQDGATGVPVGQPIGLTFNESVTLDASGVSLSCNGTSFPLSGVTATASATWSLTHGDLPNDTDCSVSIAAAAVKDNENTAMEAPVTINFRTEAAASVLPVVDSIVPANGANSVPVSSSITFRFNKPVSVAAGAVTLNCGSVIAVTDSTTTNSNELTVTPTDTVPNDTECTVLLSASKVTDAQSQSMANDFSSTYTTAGATPTGEDIFEDGFES